MLYEIALRVVIPGVYRWCMLICSNFCPMF